MNFLRKIYLRTPVSDKKIRPVTSPPCRHPCGLKVFQGALREIPDYSVLLLAITTIAFHSHVLGCASWSENLYKHSVLLYVTQCCEKIWDIENKKLLFENLVHRLSEYKRH
jgi:hypothetical protein